MRERYERPSGLKLMIEALEARQMLAGNVNVVTSLRGIDIRGDGQANAISLQATTSGDLEVSGDATQVTLNGVTASSHVIQLAEDATIDGDLRLFMRGGHDSVHIHGLIITGDVIGRTAGGEDDLLLDNTTVRGDVDVRTGGASDDFNLSNSRLEGSVFVVFGGGDRFIFGGDHLRASDTMFEGNLRVIGGAGLDSVRLTDSIVAGRSDFMLGGDFGHVDLLRSELQNLNVSNGGRDDSIDIVESTVHGAATIRLGGATDRVLIENANFQSSLVVNGGAGNQDVWTEVGTNVFAQAPNRIGFEVFE